jgi:hypothetical protein
MSVGFLFRGHEYTQILLLRNSTPFPAKFEYMDPDDESTLDVRLTVGKLRGVLLPGTDNPLPLFLKPLQLGEFYLHRSIRVTGSAYPDLPFTMTGICSGPNLKFTRDKIDFGHVNVLHPAKQVLEIFNDSLISAFWHAEIRCDNKTFSLPKATGEIPPGAREEFEVDVLLDDVVPFTGKITFYVEYLAPIHFSVSATGIGSALISSIDMKEIDFHWVFVGEAVVRTFSLTNYGRRPQEVRWQQVKPKLNVSVGASLTYSLVPDTVTILPRQEVQYTLSLRSTGPCEFEFSPICAVTLGRIRSDLFQPRIHGTFIKPVLVFTSPTMSFHYVHDVDAEEAIS